MNTGLTTVRLCLLVGLVLGLTAAFGGFVAFLIVAFFGAIGVIVGKLLDGSLDLRSLSGRTTGTR
ncbi:MAG: hypothetical protein ACR2LI_02920 [Propionibacteriaceae bacterium]